LRCVYTTGSEKPHPPTVAKKAKLPTQGGFFSALFSNISAHTPKRSSIDLPALPIEEVDPMAVYETNITLSIFSADVNVRLDKKMATELHRSTKKNPPSKLKYELIYVSGYISGVFRRYLQIPLIDCERRV
jgi:Protein of unknown function (DUF3684)